MTSQIVSKPFSPSQATLTYLGHRSSLLGLFMRQWKATQQAWMSRSRLLWWIVADSTAFYHNSVLVATTVYSPENSGVSGPGHHSPLVTTTKLPIISVIGNSVLVLGGKIRWVGWPWGAGPVCRLTLDRNTAGPLLQTWIDAGTECWWGYFILLWKCCLNHITSLSLSVYLCLITVLQGILPTRFTPWWHLGRNTSHWQVTANKW